MIHSSQWVRPTKGKARPTRSKGGNKASSFTLANYATRLGFESIIRGIPCIAGLEVKDVSQASQPQIHLTIGSDSQVPGDVRLVSLARHPDPGSAETHLTLPADNLALIPSVTPRLSRGSPILGLLPS
uniref:Uncharacterized protein n=1 Tax=Ananas comosus var. bracteatus TaxID=296719 RepID=A0A6V7NSM5_ANACO|nr:unnamed protein product [Ananas comosus var. bracteatus]